MHLLPIYNELLDISGHNLDVNFFKLINDFYSRIVTALINSDRVIPRVKGNVFKPWWNHSLNEYKEKSIESYSLWVALGKPSEGDVYQRMADNKLMYKIQISKYRELSESGFSAKLGEALLGKDVDSFWKTYVESEVSK